MTLAPHHVVVVGASLAGTRTVQALRNKGFDGPITLIGAEPDHPYDRPPLSKAMLSQDSDGAPVPLLEASRLAGLRAELVLGTAAVALDPGARRVHLDHGAPVGYGSLVIATGARPRNFPPVGNLANVHVLRSVADARRLRKALDARPRVAVLGGGFIGAEVAVAARARGLDTTIVELLPAPMARALGTEVGTLLARLHEDNGVVLHCSTTVAAVRSEAGRVTGLELAGGSLVEADLLVVGLGVEPETSWLAGSGLDVTDGVLCDSGLRAVGATGVYAAGDIARWPNPTLGRTLRVEHWTNAQEHATVVAAQICGEDQVAGALPYVWSDQYGHRLQVIGRPDAAHDVTVIEAPDGIRHLAVYENEGRVSGVFTVDAPRTMLQGRRAMANGESAAALLARV